MGEGQGKGEMDDDSGQGGVQGGYGEGWGFEMSLEEREGGSGGREGHGVSGAEEREAQEVG